MSDQDPLDLAGIEAEQFIESRKAALAALLTSLGDDSVETREEAAKILDISAKILAGRLKGEDVSFSEQALKALKSNLKSIASADVQRTTLAFVEDSLIQLATTVGRIILLI